ncbi:hypothetical protein WJ21_27550 [Burkholderia vietnamiensis]|nr:hypothetical protein WJ21_27550 [Burkholderia vietnamiensis]
MILVESLFVKINAKAISEVLWKTSVRRVTTVDGYYLIEAQRLYPTGIVERLRHHFTWSPITFDLYED